MTTMPTPEEFMMLPVEPDEDCDSDLTPLQHLAELERRVTALESGTESADTYPLVSPAETVDDEALAQLIDCAQALADLEAKHDTVLQLVEQIRGIVKKSTSKVSLDVKAAIDAWTNPAIPETVEGEEASGAAGATHLLVDGALLCNSDGPSSDHPGNVTCEDCRELNRQRVASLVASVGPPAHDADVEDWRAYARTQHRVPEGTVLDQMNRSQIRSMLGIEQPAGS